MIRFIMKRMVVDGGWGLTRLGVSRVEIGVHSALWVAGLEYREKVPD